MTAVKELVDAKPLVDGARAHLFSFEGVTPALLDAHLFGWKREMVVVKLETTVPSPNRERGRRPSVGHVEPHVPSCEPGQHEAILENKDIVFVSLAAQEAAIKLEMCARSVDTGGLKRSSRWSQSHA